MEDFFFLFSFSAKYIFYIKKNLLLSIVEKILYYNIYSLFFYFRADERSFVFSQKRKKENKQKVTSSCLVFLTEKKGKQIDEDKEEWKRR